jgi:diguanylate cyclase (GGDEF)-like protein
MNSFRKRLLVLIIGLVVVTQTVTLAAVLASTRRTVEARSWEQLRSGAGLAEQLVRFRAGQLANGVAVLAADFGFREAVASGHVPTIVSAVRNNAQRIGADLVLVLDTRGSVVATTAPDLAAPGTSLEALLQDPPRGRDPPRFRIFGAHAYQVFLAPVRTPDTIAWVLMGFVVDDSLAGRIRELVGSEVELVAHANNGETRSAATLTAGTGSSGTLAAAEDGARVTRVADVDYLSFARRLDARGDPVDVVLLKPLREVFAPYRELRDAMLLIDGVALLLAALLGAILGRGATRPIGELVRAAQRIQQGEYGKQVSVAGGEEFRALAATFNTMQQNIAAREADIIHQAEHDPLTLLPNRTLARRALEVRTRAAAQAAVILMELRNLRDINASLGHLVGDDVLREAARRLQQNVSPGDTLARVGEGQFLVIAGECPLERALLYAEQLAAVVRSGFHVGGISLELRVACGVALIPAHGRTADELLQRAQVALEEADDVRAPTVLYRAGQEGEHRRRLTLITELRGAIAQDALRLVYQPKVSMATRSVKSLEALVRWTHPQLGPVAPGEFVPLAERTGGTRALTNWVLGAAVRQLGEWRRAGLDLELAVNLSAPDILAPDLSDSLLALLRAQRVEPTALILEIRAPRRATCSCCAWPGCAFRSTTSAPGTPRSRSCRCCRWTN